MAGGGESELLAHLVEELQIKPASATAYAEALLAQDFDVELFHEVRSLCRSPTLFQSCGLAGMTARIDGVLLLLCAGP